MSKSNRSFNMGRPTSSGYGASRKSTGKLNQSFGGTGINSSFAMTGTGTVPMRFVGQDKVKDYGLGANPNSGVEDEYIGNLQ